MSLTLVSMQVRYFSNISSALQCISCTVKKVKLRTTQKDNRIFREVNALSRLSHRFIVRYYTTWVETSEPTSLPPSDTSGSDSGTEDGMTSVPHSKERFSNDRISIDLDDLDDIGSSRSSFPSIHFKGSTSSKDSSSDDEESDSDNGFGNLFGPEPTGGDSLLVPPSVARTLYIQMVNKLIY
jgi:eukaryotic translation initiation factor 2-alpha kinase 4